MFHALDFTTIEIEVHFNQASGVYRLLYFIYYTLPDKYKARN